MSSQLLVPDPGAPQATAFGHLLIMVTDVTISVNFYVQSLGFSERPAKPLADGRPFRALRQGIAFVGGREAGHRQIDHVAFEVSDVRRLRDRLRSTGVEFQEDLHDGPYGLTIYITDPDGVRVELYQPGLKV
ncbi:VOC family protein [Variovorax saccharolyticus]|uniref:VOC family protein n=1 Tax=Variovorax saccharolyticus TaxID=3053516 RepID=UPI0025757AFD|nr:VOC family protein [Variovorax sp. J31P216]MDM0029990.1 VOC family protein [Variovorax sp. J31P216]